MKALARFVMKGPQAAIMVTIVFAALPMMYWLSAAVINLVTLRQGGVEGLKVLVWGLLPGIAWWVYQGDPGTAVSLLISWLMALVLRSSVSWEKMLLAGIGLSLVFSLMIPVLEPELVEQLSAVASRVYSDVDPKMTEALGDSFDGAVRSLIVGSMAATYLLVSLCSLLLARYWQAEIFNPGGYQKELHCFRLSPVVCLGLMALVMLAPMLNLDVAVLIMIVSIPLLFAGIALVHGVVAKRKMGGHWLLAFYASVLFLGPSLLLLLVFVAVLDSWFDFRARIREA